MTNNNSKYLSMPTFNYEYIITMGDTNAMGNVYFANYFKLQGHVREVWLKNCVSNYAEHIKSDLVLSTKSAHCDFKIPLFIYDEILVKLYFSDLQRASVKLNFDFYLKGKSELYASGWQVVVFKNKDWKICRMPLDFTIAFKKYLHELE